MPALFPSIFFIIAPLPAYDTHTIKTNKHNYAETDKPTLINYGCENCCKEDELRKRKCKLRNK